MNDVHAWCVVLQGDVVMVMSKDMVCVCGVVLRGVARSEGVIVWWRETSGVSGGVLV